MKRLTYLFCLISFSLFGQTIKNGFNFYIPPYDSTSQQFLPQFTMRPIGANDFVSVKDGHFSANGNRIRFWSVNVTDAAAFPDKSNAAGVAGELRKHGFNLIRLHYLDQGKSDYSIFAKGQSTRQLNTANQDKLEKLLSELKKNGIYVDMNLHVAREFNALDGVQDADSIIEFGKGVTLFDPQLITLQKEYARSLLTHVNPYTGIALVNDPVMAMVEITNENWFFLYWQSDRLKPFKLGGMLTQRHNKMLEEQWNDFLIKKYGTTQNLAEAWGGVVAQELILNKGFEDPNITDKWSLLLSNPSAKATLTKDTQNTNSGNGSAKVSIQSSSGTDWHMQLNQYGLTIENGKEYTVEFSAKSSNSEKINFMLRSQTSAISPSFYKEVQLTNQWKKYSYTFTLNNTIPKDVLFKFQMGANSGDFWFDDVSIKLSAGTVLKSGENLESKSVHRMYKSEIYSYPPKRVKDLYEFFVTLQANYYKEMYSFLKNDLGVKVPISGSNYQMGVADAKIQSEMDYIDVHQYWDLNWDGKSFFNNSMINNPATSTIANMTGQAVEGKPFTISEYNHPWPNNYQVEAPFFLAGYGSYSDVDAVMLFGMSEADAWTLDRTLSEFNCGRNSVLMSCMPSFGYAYRNGLIASAKNTTTLNFSENDMYDLFQKGWLMYPDNLDKNIALTHKIRSRVNSPTNFDASKLPATPTNPFTSDTDELIWDKNGLLKINTDQFIGFVGFLNLFKNTEIGKVKIIDADKFAGVTLLSLDHLALGKSKKMLLTIGTRQQNSNMIWSGDKKVVDKGGSPTLVEPTKITLQFTIEADSIRVNTLGTKGEKTLVRKTYKPVSGNQFVVSFDQNTEHSLWYGIETKWESEKVISFLSPEKGTEWKVNSAQTIGWTGDVIGKKKIEYSENNGKNWKPLVSNYDATLFSYYWTIPEVESDSCRIKVTDLSDTSVSAISELFSINDNLLYNGGFSNETKNWNFFANAGSNASFSVVNKESTINITNGGSASWHVQLIQPNLKIEKGKTYDISFDASAIGARNIIVGVSQDGGSFTSYFSQSASLSTEMKNYTFSFTMAENSDNNARFAFDLGGENIDVKFDNVILREHKVEKSIAITSLQKGDVVKVNSSYIIQWTSVLINKINVYYRQSGYSSWNTIASNVSASLGKYSWSVPFLKSDSCEIKLSNAEDNTLYVISPKFFIRRPSIDFNSPKEGDIFLVNKNYDIVWTSFDVNKVNLYYKTESSSSWIKFESNLAITSGKYSWQVPIISPDYCQVKIENAENTSVNAVSPKFFIDVPKIAITSPTRNNILIVNRSYNIIWTSSDVNKVNLYYKTKNSSLWTTCGTNITATLGKCLWTVPVIPSDSCQVKIENAEINSIYTVSPSFYVAVPSVEIISIKEGETMLAGTNYEIKWKSQFVDNLNIYYKLLNSSFWIKLGDKVDAASLKYSWIIPEAANDSCQIKAEDSQYNTVSHISPKFYIKKETTDVESISSSAYSIFRIFPNPFNLTTMIEYTIPSELYSLKGSEKGTYVSLKVYNSFGTEVETLVEKFESQGTYEVTFDGSKLSGGVYFCKLTTGNYSQTKKLILMK